ncbi:MAG: aldo/keto reductase [Planctomycetota bacterium]|nr:aldo/keto reductase [Planctomycetota bacterium]
MRRTLGKTTIEVTPVAMGCWPIAGMTSIDVNDADSLKTLNAAIDNGINFFDTAYCYGAQGESEKLISQAFAQRRDEIVIATKAGIHWDEKSVRGVNGRPERIKVELDESLKRLNTDRVELLYHHAPDPEVRVADSAGAFRELLDTGKALSIGVSNYSVEQMEEFSQICPISAAQPHYNMLQREIENDVLPWCRDRGVSVICYWPLMKGLLAGQLKRDHQFKPNDGRKKYPMFQGQEWEKNQDFVDELSGIANETGKTVSQVVINWTIQQPGITVALCGAKRAYQIAETSGALGWQLSPGHLDRINSAIQKRGPVVSKAAV